MDQPGKPSRIAKTGPSSFSTRPQPMLDLERFKGRMPNRLPQRWLWLAAAAVICLAAGFGGGWLGARVYTRGNTGLATSTAAKQQYVSNESQLIESIAKNVGQSVVSVDVTGQDTTAVPDIFGFSQPQTQQTQSAGTGFIISPSGIIATNRHVVPSGTTSVSVTLADGTKYDNVQVIGRTGDASSQDIAFLKIGDLKGKTLVPVTLGDSSGVQIGDKVIAIGNALGQFQNTVTSGIISGYGRDVSAGDQSGLQASEILTDLFQTDAAINEGNSGGPLVNINGEVIGINTAVASDAQNIGFAQPINDLRGLISSVLDSGQLQQPYLGVRYVSLTNDLAKEFNLKVTRGAYILSGNDQPAVVDGSPAARAGLKDKDIITKVNNVSIDNKTSLTSALSKFKVGQQVNLTIVRSGKTINIKVSLGNAPTS
jgi:serine protease Do